MKKIKQLAPEQLYKRNQLRQKIYKNISAPIYWILLALSILFFVLMLRNSFGNISEIISMLDKKTLTGEELQANYSYLIEKYGEWTIVGKNAGVFSIQFIDIRKAFFSAVMITYLILSIVCLVLAVTLGKILFPKLSDYYSNNNQDMVNIATLQTNAEITKKKKSQEEWF